MRHRRKLLSLLLALVLLLTPACGRAKAPAEYRVALATDLHYLSPALRDGGEMFQKVIAVGDGKVTEYCDEVTDAFLAEVLRLGPEALILTGDLSYNGERESHLALAEKLEAVEAAGVPVLVLPGNHDLYRSCYAFLGEEAEAVPSVTAEEFREIYAAFGFDEALALDPDSLSYAAPLNDSARVLMLDANTLHNPCGLSDKTLAWVEEQLRAADKAGQQVLVACHQNLFRHTMFGREAARAAGTARRAPLPQRAPARPAYPDRGGRHGDRHLFAHHGRLPLRPSHRVGRGAALRGPARAGVRLGAGAGAHGPGAAGI